VKYIDSFRNPGAATRLKGLIAEKAQGIECAVVMEVCGSHTMAIGRYGIRELLPPNVELLSGPGCPVCVTAPGYIDAAIELADRGCRLVTFGDMMQVPGSAASLGDCRSRGGVIDVCYSPADAARIAIANPGTEVVFLAIGFETTVAPVVSLIETCRAQQIDNLSLLTAFKLIPPALRLLVADPDLRIDAFLCPAHVSAIIGSLAYEEFAEASHVPCVIAGFEPLDILLGILGCVQQIACGEARVDNQYSRVVKSGGNTRAKELMNKYLSPVDAAWRGMGVLPGSALGVRPEYAHYDAATRHGISVLYGDEPAACRCGDVIKGKIHPPDCPLFAGACNPDHPIGPCMVSVEGSCSAWFQYEPMEG